MKYKILVLHACCCIIFGVFEFKFMFEFMCMIVFLNRKNNSFSSSSPSSLLLVFLFWPKNSEVQRRPSYSFPAAAANPAAQQADAASSPAPARPHAPSSAVADTRGPCFISLLAPSPSRIRRRRLTPPGVRLPSRSPHAMDHPGPYLSRRRPRGPLSRTPAVALYPSAATRETLTPLPHVVVAPSPVASRPSTSCSGASQDRVRTASATCLHR
jgi:hypothetical protein